MNKYTQDVINTLKEFGYNTSDIKVETIDDTTDHIIINGIPYPIVSGLDDKHYEDIAYFISSNSDLSISDEISEALDSDDNTSSSSVAPSNILPLDESYPSLLVALDSERDAEVTYKTLIDIEKNSENPDKQVIDLLEKILKEELQHIALLSALQANNNSEFVEEDSQEDFDSYINNIKEDE